MRIEDLCTAAPPPPDSPRAQRVVSPPAVSPLLQPSLRLPALSALIAPLPSRKPAPMAPSVGSSLTVTIRIPSKNRARYEVESTQAASNVGARTPPLSSQTPPEVRGRSASVSPVRQRPKRKRCEETRKLESAQLLDELHDLEARLTKLKRGNAEDDAPSSPRSELKRSRAEMQLYIASLGSMLLQRVPQVVAAPVHTYIHLGCSLEDRQRTIMQIKPEQLRIGRQLVEERSRFLDTTHPHSTNEWYTTDDGDVCGLHFYVEQVHGCHDILGAFSAALSYVSSYEVTPKKTVSVMTYRDSSLESTHSSTLQLRVLLTTAVGPVVEANSLLFTRYFPDENVGVIVGNYVDKDDLRPYEPTKRVRQEVTAVCLLSPSPVGVIVRHWIFVRTRNAPHLLDPTEFGPFARENQGHNGDELVLYIRNQLLPKESSAHGSRSCVSPPVGGGLLHRQESQ